VQISAQEILERTGAIVDNRASLKGSLLPILHDVQAEFVYMPRDVLRVIAEKLNLSRAEVHGVMTFYHDFREEPAGLHVLKIYRAEACQPMNGDQDRRLQTRLTFARCGVTDPLSLNDYRAHGGLAGLAKAVAMQPAEIVATVVESGLRGRGSAGFPTGIKWKTTLETKAEQKYIVCNADEGDSGTLADRMIMEGDLFSKKAPPELRALTDRKAREARSHIAK
jgi:hypothetical protein